MERDLVMMARRNELEVEDIIEAVVDRDPSVAALLESLSAELQWLEKDAAKQQRQVPFSTWSRIAATFVRSGYSGLVTTAISDRRPGPDFGFCTAFLESYKTPESVSALVEIIRTIDEWTTEARVQTATAINLVLSFKGTPSVSTEQEEVLRHFLHESLEETTTAADQAVVLCALRGVGDERSFSLADAIGNLPDPWEGTVGTVKRAIRKRCRQAVRRGHGGAVK